jgi:hypothetical protein
MGLDTTHNCWHGAYSAFNRWRDKLAEVAGYTFHESVGSHDPIGSVIIDIDWGNIEKTIGTDLNGEWPAIPVRPDGTPDPLIILLAHSDCEGELQTEFLEPLADRIEELIPHLGEEDGGGHIGLFKDKTEKFVKGLRLAAKRNEKVEFY